MIKYFRDLREFHNDYENFCHKIFLTAAYSTGFYTEKSVNHKNQARSQKFKTTEIWSYTVCKLTYNLTLTNHLRNQFNGSS